jgi:hypothetical protein
MSALKPWYEVAQPHRDIREGHLDESVFAANLWQVMEGVAPRMYSDLATFAKTTYATRGLKAVLKRVEAGLEGRGDAGDRIISLQTSFGGGKTHTLLALYHLATSSAAKLEEQAEMLWEAANVKDGREPVKVAVFTNQSCDPQQGREVEDGLTVHTLWGDLAYQLGGKKLYELVRPNDEARTTPKGVFAKVLAQAAPALILIDELADYCSAAAGVKVEASTLDDQTISFVQELTEAVQQTPGVVLVATLPASDIEIANSQKGTHILTSLEKRMGRMGADVKPVSDDEIFEVVRRRLFEEVGSKEEQEKTVEAYVRLYNEHLDEVPPESLRADYRELMLRAYPFHPSLIEALHTRWGSHPDFQRTRGVLRLLAAIVGDLWERRNASTQSQALIQPCHLRFDLEALVGQVTRLYGANFQAVLASDVVGAGSNAAKIDSERGGDYAREQLASGLAAAITLGSFGGTAEHSGWSARDLKIAVARPVVNWSYTDGALSALEEKCFYLHTTTEKLGKRYWLTAKPTLNKLVLQHVQSVTPDDVEKRISLELRGLDVPSGTFTRLLVEPSRDLPEQKELTLLALSPSRAWGGRGSKAIEKEVLALSTLCGRRERLYRNTLVFLAPSESGLGILNDAVRTVLALERIKSDYGSQLDPEQRDDLKERTERERTRLVEAIADCYSVVLRVKGANTVESVEMPPGKRGDTAKYFEGIFRQLQDASWLIGSVGRLTLEKAGLWPTPGHPVNVKEATDAFLRFTDKEILTHAKAVANGLTELVRKRQLGIAYGGKPESLSGQSAGEAVSIDPMDESIWVVDIGSVAAPTAEGMTATTGSTSSVATGTSDSGSSSSGDGAVGSETAYSSVHVSGRVPLESWSDVFASFIRPLTASNADLTIKIDITGKARAGGSIPGKLVDQGGIKEAAKQMGLDVEAEDLTTPSPSSAAISSVASPSVGIAEGRKGVAAGSSRRRRR